MSEANLVALVAVLVPIMGGLALVAVKAVYRRRASKPPQAPPPSPSTRLAPGPEYATKAQINAAMARLRTLEGLAPRLETIEKQVHEIALKAEMSRRDVDALCEEMTELRRAHADGHAAVQRELGELTGLLRGAMGDRDR